MKQYQNNVDILLCQRKVTKNGKILSENGRPETISALFIVSNHSTNYAQTAENVTQSQTECVVDRFQA